MLETHDLILRTVTEQDLDEVARMWLYPDITTRDTVRQVLAVQRENHEKNRPNAIYHLCLGVFLKEAPRKIIGWCGLDGKAEAGKTVLFYMIDEQYRCKGYGTQCASALLRYAFEDMAYEAVYGGCAKDNTASFKVMSKAGMMHCAATEDGDYSFWMNREMYLKRRS